MGNSVKACSEFLKIAPSTLENHKASIMKKLRVNKSIDLVRIATCFVMKLGMTSFTQYRNITRQLIP